MLAAPSHPIVVGSDGSPTAAVAVRRAAELAQDRGVELHVVIAYADLTPGQRREVEEMPDEFKWLGSAGQMAEKAVADAARAANAPAVTIKTHAEYGDPTSVLIDVARSVGADTIVVGNRGMQGLSGFVRGSVPNRLSHRAPCDVLIVDTSEEAA